MTIYWESPEKAQSHIQPRDVSPGLLLLMLSSVIREKLDVLQILQVWSAEQVANRLEGIKKKYIYKSVFDQQGQSEKDVQCVKEGGGHSRGIRAELAAQGVAFVCRDLGFGDELRHLVSCPSSQVPHITVSLLEKIRDL